MSSPEPTRKKSPHLGVSRTHLKGLDAGVQKTIGNAIQRWQEKRIAFIEGLPEITQQELAEEGLLEAPTLTIPGATPPVVPQRSRPPVHVNGTTGGPRTSRI